VARARGRRSPHADFVDALREFLGVRPLYGDAPKPEIRKFCRVVYSEVHDPDGNRRVSVGGKRTSW
jgi:hypothetical protein